MKDRIKEAVGMTELLALVVVVSAATTFGSEMAKSTIRTIKQGLANKRKDDSNEV